MRSDLARGMMIVAVVGVCSVATLWNSPGFAADGTDDPPAGSADKNVVDCKLDGAATGGSACGLEDPNCGASADDCGPDDLTCTNESHTLNLATYVASQKRAGSATCGSGALASQGSGAAYACFDKAASNLSECRQVSLRNSRFGDELTATLRAKLDKDIASAMTAAIAAHHCDSSTVLCLDRNGKPLGGEKILQKGDSLKVLVLSVDAYDVGAVSLTVVGIKSTETLTRSGSASDNKQGTEPRGVQVYVLASVVSDPIGDNVVAVRVAFRRDDHVAHVSIRPDPITIDVDQGRYFVDFGLAVPFVVDGDRVVTQSLAIDKTTAPRAAISAVIFPAGRPKNKIRVEGAQAWGLQIGTDFDFTKAIDQKDYYFGGAWEPIAGFGIGAGVALVRGQYISGTAGMPSSSYLAAPYIGVFLTPDFVSSARAAVTALQAK